MVPPSLSNHVPVEDTEFVAFINEFLFHPPPQASSGPSSPRHQRTPSKHKRYKSLWRAASASLMKRRYASQETHFLLRDHILRKLSPQVPVANVQSCKEAHLPMADHLHSKIVPQISVETGLSSQGAPLADETLKTVSLRASLDDGCSSQAIISSSAGKLPSQVFLDNGQGSQGRDVHALNNFPSQGSLDYDYGEATIDSQRHTRSRKEEVSLFTPACSNSKEKGIASSNVKPLEEVVPKHSARKPPRPPKAIVSRSGSYRAIRLKTAARRMMPNKARLREQKLPKRTSNSTFIWAWIVTFCFASIMLVQSFLGNSSKDFISNAEGQSAVEGIPLRSSILGVPSSAPKSSPRILVAEHGAGASLDKSQKASKTSLFSHLQRHRSRRPQPHPARLRLLN